MSLINKIQVLRELHQKEHECLRGCEAMVDCEEESAIADKSCRHAFSAHPLGNCNYRGIAFGHPRVGAIICELEDSLVYVQDQVA